MLSLCVEDDGMFVIHNIMLKWLKNERQIKNCKWFFHQFTDVSKSLWTGSFLLPGHPSLNFD